MEERDLHERLAELSRARGCLGWDACPGPGGLLYTIDGYAEEESRLPWMTMQDWGFRAVAHAVSDIVASGGTPLAVWYSVGVPSPSLGLEVARGVGQAAERLGLRVLKSDYNRAERAWIDVAAVGAPAGGRAVSRRGGRPGDVLFQVGYLGYGLLERLALEGRVPREHAGRVMARLPPVGAARAVSLYASASADNSDGWARTLWELAYWSRVGIEVEVLVLDPWVEGVLEELYGGVPWGLVFESWEDYTLAVLVPGERAESFEEECRAGGSSCWRVGRTVDRVGVWYRGVSVGEGGWSWV